MKLTVSFGGTKVVVPCGDGGMTIRDLIEKALHRYKKSVSRDSTPTSHSGLLPTVGQTRVHSVTLARDGGLLDWDDCVRDVLDDRELVIAHTGSLIGGPGAGDGTSASGESLLSTSSPASSGVAIGKGRVRAVTVTAVPTRLTRAPPPPLPANLRPDSDAVVVTPSDISQGSKLLVRRGSDPSEGSPTHARKTGGRSDGGSSTSSNHSDDYTKPGPRRTERQPGAPIAGEVFARSASRQSLGNNPALLQWLDAQERLAGEAEEHRSEPVGRSSPEASPVPQAQVLVVIPQVDESGVIGVSVKPWYVDEEHRCDGKECLPPGQRLIRGMEVHFIADGGRLQRDGRVRVGDRIIEVNDIHLHGLPYQRAQEIFRKASQASELRLLVIPSISTRATPSEDSDSSSRPSAAPPLPKRSPNTQLTGDGPTTPKTNSIDRSAANTKKIGVKHQIQLSKDVDGLGFSLTTRDNATNGPNPVYVKNILPQGNAIKDGRLRAGDRMLEVNGVDVSGATQSEVVHLLRSVPVGATVHLTVSRIGEVAREDDEEEEDGEEEEVTMQLDIPLNETGAAGLGISVKGRSKQRSDQDQDVLDGVEEEGVFINSVITGGAASKDARLRVNDQLLEVNGKSLRGMANKAAMGILRDAMQMRQGPRPGYIRLRVSRRQRRVAAQVHPRQFNVPAENKVSHNPAYTDSSSASTPMDSPQKPPMNASGGRNRRKLPAEPPSGKASTMTPTPSGSGSGLRRGRPVTAPTPGQVMRRYASAENLDSLYPDSANDSDGSSGSDFAPGRRDGTDRRGRTPFRREGMGRRSMSEKRRAHVDARQFEFYEEWKAARQSREASNDRGYHTLPTRLHARPPPGLEQRSGRPCLPPDYASVLSAMEDEFTQLSRAQGPQTTELKQSRSHLNLTNIAGNAKSRAPVAGPGTRLDPLIGPLPTLSPYGPSPAVGSGGGMKRAISVESLLSSVRSAANGDPSLAGSSHTTGRPLSRSRPNNNSFRRAVDPSYSLDLPPPPPPPHPSQTRKASTGNPTHLNNAPQVTSAQASSSGFFKNLFRRGVGGSGSGKTAPPPPPPTQPSSMPSTPVSTQPPGPSPFARAPPPPPPPRTANFPLPPPGPPVVESSITSVESRVLQWQRQNLAAMWAVQPDQKPKAQTVTPKRAPAPPPVNYEMRGPPSIVSNSNVPPLPPPPNNRMRRHIYEDVGGYEPVGRPTNLNKPASGKGPAPAPPRPTPGSGRPSSGQISGYEASHPVLSHYMVGDNQDIYARVNKP